MRQFTDALRLASDIAKDLISAQIAWILLFLQTSAVRSFVPIAYRFKGETTFVFVLMVVVMVRSGSGNFLRKEKPSSFRSFAFFLLIKI